MTTECMENSTQKSSKSTYMKFYMQNKRKDEKFRQKELDKKRRSRQDSNAKLTENERDCDRKRQSRQDPGFHANELDKKRRSRQDPGFQTEELNRKRQSRQDAAFQAEELNRKRLARENPLNLEKERISKQSSRQKNPHKDKAYNKSIKRNKRKDPKHLQHETELKKRKLYGATIEDCIRQFEQKISVDLCMCVLAVTRLGLVTL